MSRDSVLFLYYKYKMRIFFLYTCLLVLRNVHAGDAELHRYSMAELELMAKNKEWSKVILFIKDVPKQDQDLQWRSLLERSVLGFLQDLRKEGFSTTEKLVQDLAFEFPALRDSYKFETLKDEIFLEGYSRCFSKKSDVLFCSKSAINLMNQKITSAKLKQQLAVLVYSNNEESLRSLCQVFEGAKEKIGFFDKNCLEQSKSKIEK